MKEYLETAEAVAIELKTDARAGLTGEEAAQRIAVCGENKLREKKKTPLAVRFFKQLADPMIIILIAAAVISLVLVIVNSSSGEGFDVSGLAEVIIIVAVVLLNAILGMVQEAKADSAIEALRELTAAECKVIRDGRQERIKSSALVPGDLISLEAGDSVPADARVTMSASLKCEESALTGESVPSEKSTGALSGDDVPLGDRANMVYSGSTVVYGRGMAIVTATGMNTEMGKIAGVLESAREEKTPLQKKLSWLSKLLTVVVVAVCAVVFAVNLIRADVVNEVTVLGSLVLAVSLAVAAIPEGLATVVTIVLSMGVTKMSARGAVLRKLTAVETLGCAEIICSDKTGTLTQNKMTVTESYGSDIDLLARAMSLCSDSKVVDGEVSGEPTENALVAFALGGGFDKTAAEAESPRAGEIPFDSMRKMMTVFFRKGGGFVQYTKGAPDEVLKRCTKITDGGVTREMTDDDRRKILGVYKSWADRALRVLAAAEKDCSAITTDAEAAERDMTFIGMTGMTDPVRPEVKAAVEECRRAGIRPVMITGDHVDTAVAIGLELGIIKDRSEAITGAELDEIGDEDFAEGVKRYSVYARVRPEHKTRIVNAWKALGKVTAMTGDGVNDAPSIKAADIGVGMGITGTDVTKNVADMVLSDDNFATIVTAVGEGRRIYDNIRKAILYLLSSNLAEVIAVFIASMMGFTVLGATQLLWINMIGDTFPALSMGLEKAEKNVMTRPPRPAKQGLFADGLGVDLLVQGVAIAALTLLAYFVGNLMTSGEPIVNTTSNAGTTAAFFTFCAIKLFHAFNVRSQRRSAFDFRDPNVMLFITSAASLALTTAIIYIPGVNGAFGLEPISAGLYFVCLAVGFAIIPVSEAMKLVRYFVRRRRNVPKPRTA